MTARFAGSRTLDDRRRRWLATNEAEQSQSVASETAKSADSSQSPEPAELQISQFPLRKIISPKVWKLVLAGFLVILLGSGLLAAGSLSEETTKTFGPGWNRLVDANGGQLARLFHAGLLILSGQCAWLIWWVRSQSLRDFEGQYHVWLLASVTAIAAGFCILGDWHLAFSETVCWFWSAQFPKREVLCWMLPAAFVLGVVWRKLRADMRRCKSSSVLLWLAGGFFAGMCIFRLGIDRTGWNPAIQQLAEASLHMLTCACVFLSFLTHARFVIHISAEPPMAQPSLWSKLLGLLVAIFRVLPKPRLSLSIKWKKPATDPSDETTEKPKQVRKRASAKTSAKDSKPEPKPEPVQKTKEPSDEDSPEKIASRKPARSQTPAKEPEPPTIEKPERTPVSAKPSEPDPKPEASDNNRIDDSSDDETQYRVDQPLDPESLKGLSKKERRRLRKQHRDAQREA